MMEINLASNDIQTDSILDGEGIRTVIWMQGCLHHCKGCHNPETHNLSGGVKITLEEMKKKIDTLENQDGITLSGGDPLYQPEAANEIAKYCKSKGLNIWCYTGFTLEELIEKSKIDNNIKELLENIDVLVDGKFKIEEKSLNLQFKGSRNQRIIDVRKSLQEHKIIEIEKYKNEKSFTGYNRNENCGIYI